MITKESILELLKTNDKAVAHALVVLHKRQTADEQAIQGTRYLNGMGFRPCHARMGSSMATFYQRTGRLTPKQVAYWRVLDKTGAMRIGIYWKQLQEAAEEKELQRKVLELQAKGTPTLTNVCHPPILLPVERDLGNDMERKAHLEYELGMAMDSDDPKIIDPIKNEIDEIDAFWKKIRPNG